MKADRAALAALAVTFLSPALSGGAGGPGVRGLEAFQFAIVGCSCAGTLVVLPVVRSRGLLLIVFFAATFALLQGVAWSILLALSLIGTHQFSWGLIALGPVGLVAAFLCVRSFQPKLQLRWRE